MDFCLYEPILHIPRQAQVAAGAWPLFLVVFSYLYSMIFHEKDIEFSTISWKQFEELCFDLLIKFQFHSLIWRQGGQDKGRDIEALFTVTNPITGSYPEKWFIECKLYKKGISVADISNKIEWAKAEKANHFMLLTNSYVTQTTRDWLNKHTEALNLRIHLVEGKQLKQTVLPFSDLILRYFFNDNSIAVGEMLKLWVIFDILPEPGSLYQILRKIDAGRLKADELSFLLFAFIQRHEAIENYCRDDGLPLIDCDFLLPQLAINTNTQYPIFTNEEMKLKGLHPNLYSSSIGSRKSADCKTVHIYRPYKDNNQLEIYLCKENKTLVTKVALGKKSEIETSK